MSQAVDWNELRRTCRLRLLKMHFDSRVGHIGGNLSCLDILLALYHGVLGPRDQCVLSKGHAAGALYIALWSRGLIADDELTTFHRDNTRLSGHPAPGGVPEIPFATGSLGHGLSLAAGMALSRRFETHVSRVYCLTSDGEWNEGSTWEALVFARQQRLNNLVLLVDLNGLQGFGSTAEVADLSPLGEKFAAFGWSVAHVDGHDPAAIAKACQQETPSPLAIVAHTHKGQGVSFMQDQMDWHYLPLSPEQYALALQEAG